MSKIYGGHTVLGDNLNNAHGKSLRGKIDEYKEKKAIIKASYKNTYFFYLTVFNKDGTTFTTKPIRLLGSNDYLAMIGEPNELIGHEVIIGYRGSSINRGVAKLSGTAGATVASEVQDAEMSNRLEVQGTSFAPPVPL